MTGEQGTVHHRPSRTSVEVGLVVSVVAMLLGLSFNAGIQYAHIAQLDTRTTTLETKYEEMDHAQTPIQVRLGHIETLLQVIQSQQAKLQHSVDAKDRKG